MPRKSKKGHEPLIMAASKKVREEFQEAYRRVVEAYAAASTRLRAGERNVRFPEGTFPPALAFVSFSAEARAG
jgi:hypothetical protein